MTTPREDAIAALPVLRLTGEQLDSLNADEFIIDWDEHDEFVRLSQVRAALAAAPETPREDAIVTAVNLFPLYEAVREAARELLYIGAVRPFRDAAEDRLGAALDALQAAEDAL